MKNILRIVLPLVAAVVIGGGGGYYAVDELVMRRPQSVVEAMARARTRAAERAAEKVAKSEKVAKGECEEKRAGARDMNSSEWTVWMRFRLPQACTT